MSKRKTTLTNHEILSLISAISSFQENSKEKDVPASISYCINKNSIELQKSYKTFEDTRQLLISKHVKRSSDGASIVSIVKTENGEVSELQMNDEKAFENDANLLLLEKQEVELYQFEKIEEKISNWVGNQGVMEELWYLIDIINHYTN